MANKKEDVFKLVDMKGRSVDECWPWKGKTHAGTTRPEDRRPIFHYNGKRHYAYRVVYELYNGVVLTEEDKVRHTCDNPLCCNPFHHLIGTQADNVQDMMERERVGREIQMVRKCMELLENGATGPQVVEYMKKNWQFEVNAEWVRKVKARTTYAHVEWPWGDERRRRLDAAKKSS